MFLICVCPQGSPFLWPGLTLHDVTAQEVTALLGEGTGSPAECLLLGNGPPWLPSSAGLHQHTWQLSKAFLRGGRGD